MPNKILEREPSLAPLKAEITALFTMVRDAFAAGNRLYICGNGGSFADSLHIAGELVKSFERRRPISTEDQRALEGRFGHETLAMHLERGLPAIPLGMNPILNSALLNDCDEKEILFAQELFVMGRPGDVLLGISTSGNARDVMLAVSAARVRGMRVAVLTGRDGGLLKKNADTAVVVKARTTREIQQVHQVIYHTLCLMLEKEFYG
ncbi:MAG: SIS domain-containing protein [Planctomycetota bacterium]